MNNVGKTFKSSFEL